MKIDIMHMRNPPHSLVQTKYLYKSDFNGNSFVTSISKQSSVRS